MPVSVLIFTELHELSPARLQSWWRALSPQDQSRAGGFGSERRRAQFIVGRHLLAYAVHHRLGDSPSIVTAASGAPELSGAELCCSIAHSERGVAVALGRGTALGVDLEWRRLRRFQVLAAHYFHPLEADALASLPEHQQAEAFYRLWTRKEAIAKAAGTGITLATLIAAEPPPDMALYTQAVDDFVVSVACGDTLAVEWHRLCLEGDDELVHAPLAS